MTEEELETQRLEQEDKTSLVPFAKSRYEVCKSCHDFIPVIRVCKHCYCFMPAKVMIECAVCPNNYW